MIRATFLALALVGASAFAPSATKSINTVMHGETSYVDVIGADPGPIEPSGFMYESVRAAGRLPRVCTRTFRRRCSRARAFPRYEETESFARRRAVEIKHGRIAMMAFIGMIVQELQVANPGQYLFPGSMTLDGSVPFDSILKDGMGFPALANVPQFGLVQIALFGAIAELVAMPASQYEGGPQNLPGGYDGSQGTIPGGYPFTTQIEDVTERNRALTVELQNGRGAMVGVFGCMCQSMVDSCDHHFFYPITHN